MFGAGFLIQLPLVFVMAMAFTEFGKAVDCERGWTKVQNQCYKFSERDMVSWSEAVKICLALGARLFSIDSSAEISILKNLQASHPDQDLFIWARYSPFYWKARPLRNYLNIKRTHLGDLFCFGLDVATGQSAVAPCQDQKPYVCETWDAGDSASAIDWTDEEHDPNHDLHTKGPLSVLQLTGGILAGLMLGSLMLIAFGVSITVCIRRWKESKQQDTWPDEETPEGDFANFEPRQTIAMLNVNNSK